jgi:hypothetical protein
VARLVAVQGKENAMVRTVLVDKCGHSNPVGVRTRARVFAQRLSITLFEAVRSSHLFFSTRDDAVRHVNVDSSGQEGQPMADLFPSRLV